MEYVTKTGKVLTDADLDALAEEAERGYDIEPLLARQRPTNSGPVGSVEPA